METKTKKSRDRGGENAVWVKLAVPATGKLRDGLVAGRGANRSGSVCDLSSGAETRLGLAAGEEGQLARDLMGLVPSLGFRRGKRSPPTTSGRGKS